MTRPDLGCCNRRPVRAAQLNYDNRSVHSGAHDLGYRIEGDGERKVVLIHGLNSHSGSWRKCFPTLAQGATVVAPSLPPHRGKATSELANQYAEMVAAVCEHAGIEVAGVVGNSMGGWVAMRLLTMRTGLVSRVALEDTAGSTSGDLAALEGARIPVLILWGESDPILPIGVGRNLHSRLSMGELRVLPGVGHVPHWEAPEVFNRIVGEFLRRR